MKKWKLINPSNFEMVLTPTGTAKNQLAEKVIFCPKTFRWLRTDKLPYQISGPLEIFQTNFFCP